MIFARVLVPDALILVLHAHTHTEHAGSVEEDQHHPKLEQAHTHCPTENVFHSPFQFVLAGQDIPAPVYPETHSDQLLLLWDFSFPSTITLRGPPVA